MNQYLFGGPTILRRLCGFPKADETHARSICPGDVEAAMQTAAAIGDDRLQRQSQGYVVPDAFTHGSSTQRVRWFTTGLKSGSLSSCNTFEAAQQ
jgi:uncharacterized protein